MRELTLQEMEQVAGGEITLSGIAKYALSGALGAVSANALVNAIFPPSVAAAPVSYPLVAVKGAAGGAIAYIAREFVNTWNSLGPEMQRVLLLSSNIPGKEIIAYAIS